MNPLHADANVRSDQSCAQTLQIVTFLVEERHLIKPPPNATPEEYHCIWYSLNALLWQVVTNSDRNRQTMEIRCRKNRLEV
jgi:hypothetical protein